MLFFSFLSSLYSVACYHQLSIYFGVARNGLMFFSNWIIFFCFARTGIWSFSLYALYRGTLCFVMSHDLWFDSTFLYVYTCFRAFQQYHVVFCQLHLVQQPVNTSSCPRHTWLHIATSQVVILSCLSLFTLCYFLTKLLKQKRRCQFSLLIQTRNWRMWVTALCILILNLFGCSLSFHRVLASQIWVPLKEKGFGGVVLAALILPMFPNICIKKAWAFLGIFLKALNAGCVRDYYLRDRLGVLFVLSGVEICQ